MMSNELENYRTLTELWKEASDIFEYAYEKKHTHEDIPDWEREQAQGKADGMRKILTILRGHSRFGGRSLDRSREEMSGEEAGPTKSKAIAEETPTKLISSSWDIRPQGKEIQDRISFDKDDR